MVGWLVSWLVLGRLVGWLVGWLVDWIVLERLVDWLVMARLNDWLNGLLLWDLPFVAFFCFSCFIHADLLLVVVCHVTVYQQL